MDKVKRVAYWFWRNSGTTEPLDDIQSEAVLASLQCGHGLEIVAARRAIIDYLRKVNHTRSTGSQCMVTVWWEKPLRTPPIALSRLIAEEERQRLIRAVECLPALELRVIREEFWSDGSQAEKAARVGISSCYFSRLKGRAIRTLALFEIRGDA